MEDKERLEILQAFSFLESNIIYYERIAEPTEYQAKQTWLIARDLAIASKYRHFILDMRKSTELKIKTREIAKESATLLEPWLDQLIFVYDDSRLNFYLEFISRSLNLEMEVLVALTLEDAIEKVQKYGADKG